MSQQAYSKKEAISMASEIGDRETGNRSGAGMGTFFLGMLAGAVVAGVAVLLLAPRPGRETRAMLRDKAMETRKMLQDRMGDVSEKLGRVRPSAQSRSESGAENTGDTQ
jgi:gas vesicle protein